MKVAITPGISSTDRYDVFSIGSPREMINDRKGSKVIEQWLLMCKLGSRNKLLTGLIYNAKAWLNQAKFILPLMKLTNLSPSSTHSIGWKWILISWLHGGAGEAAWFKSSLKILLTAIKH